MAHRNGSPAHSHNGHSTNGRSRVVPDGHGNGPGGAPLPVDWESLARATAHPVRIGILELLGMDGGRTLSPSDLCLELQIPLSNTNYHVTELAKAGLIELTGLRPVRGATEHFYRIAAPVSKQPPPERSTKRTAELEPVPA